MIFMTKIKAVANFKEGEAKAEAYFTRHWTDRGYNIFIYGLNKPVRTLAVAKRKPTAGDVKEFFKKGGKVD